jgi:hypothetical protein
VLRIHCEIVWSLALAAAVMALSSSGANLIGTIFPLASRRVRTRGIQHIHNVGPVLLKRVHETPHGENRERILVGHYSIVARLLPKTCGGPYATSACSEEAEVRGAGSGTTPTRDYLKAT